MFRIQIIITGLEDHILRAKEELKSAGEQAEQAMRLLEIFQQRGLEFDNILLLVGEGFSYGAESCKALQRNFRIQLIQSLATPLVNNLKWFGEIDEAARILADSIINGGQPKDWNFVPNIGFQPKDSTENATIQSFEEQVVPIVRQAKSKIDELLPRASEVNLKMRRQILRQDAMRRFNKKISIVTDLFDLN